MLSQFARDLNVSSLRIAKPYFSLDTQENAEFYRHVSLCLEGLNFLTVI